MNRCYMRKLARLKVLASPLNALADYLLRTNRTGLGYFFQTLSGFWIHALSMYQTHVLVTDDTFGFSAFYIYMFSTVLWIGGFIVIWYLHCRFHDERILQNP